MPAYNTQICDFVAAGKLAEALDMAKQWALSGLPDLDTPVTLLSSEFEYLERSFINGLLSPAEEASGRTNIAARLLSLVDDIKSTDVRSVAEQAARDVILLS